MIIHLPTFTDSINGRLGVFHDSDIKTIRIWFGLAQITVWAELWGNDGILGSQIFLLVPMLDQNDIGSDIEPVLWFRLQAAQGVINKNKLLGFVSPFCTVFFYIPLTRRSMNLRWGIGRLSPHDFGFSISVLEFRFLISNSALLQSHTTYVHSSHE